MEWEATPLVFNSDIFDNEQPGQGTGLGAVQPHRRGCRPGAQAPGSSGPIFCSFQCCGSRESPAIQQIQISIRGYKFVSTQGSNRQG